MRVAYIGARRRSEHPGLAYVTNVLERLQALARLSWGNAPLELALIEPVDCSAERQPFWSELVPTASRRVRAVMPAS